MLLNEYIKKNNLSHKEFADQLGISETALSNYIHKRREPRPHIRRKIISVTSGKVKIEDLLK